MASVAQVADAAGVSQAAVRAQLAAGTLLGHQEPRGRRVVWVVDDAAAEQYIAGRRGRTRETSAPVVSRAPNLTPPVDGAPTTRGSELGSSGPGTGVPVGAGVDLALENAQLRAALAALTRAHQALVDLVEVTYTPVAHQSR